MYLRPATENMATKEMKDQEKLNSGEVDDDAEEKGAFDTDIQSIIRYGSEVATLIGVLSYVIFQVIIKICCHFIA